MHEEERFDSDDNDPVVKEIPIYLSKRLDKQLFVFQYPLRPKNLKSELAVRKAFFKPNNKEVKLETSVNIQSCNFDTAKAEDLAEEIDGPYDPKRKKDLIFESRMVDKLVLTSTRVVQETQKYAVGVYNGREYHVTPLEGFLQLRPCVDYLDKSSKRKKDESTDDEEAGPSSAQAVTVKFSRGDTEKTSKARENSYKKLKEKSDSEKWTECKWHSDNSTNSEVVRQKLLSEVLDDMGQAMNITPAEYIKILVPDDQEQAIITPSLPSNVVSLHSLRALPIQDQCRLLLKDAKIIQYQQLMMLLAGGVGFSSEALLKSLPQVAVLVRGSWVVKSEILYPQNSQSAISGVPAELMCRARDYVLYLFTKNQYVERRKVCTIIRIPSEEVKEIFTSISKLRHNKGWELVLPIDTDFINKYTEIVARQQALWEQRAQQLSEFFKEVPAKEKRRRKSKSVSEEVVRVKKESISSDTDSGTEKNKSPIAARKGKS